MPLYDFTCTHCGTDFEDVCGTDENAPACPSCGNAETQRRLSAPGIKRNAAPFKVGPKRPMSPARNSPCGGTGCGC